MKHNWISRSTEEHSGERLELPNAFLADASAPQDYIMDEGLEAAANVAIELGQPLLLTGAPGTGKTRFAHHLAWQLGLGKPLEFHTKSTSTAGDLFYTYDAVRSFRSAQRSKNSGTVDEWEFVQFNALGLAILRSLPGDEAAAYYRGSSNHWADTPQRSVVLIDEIDKAPRDFPNDLLNEIPTMSFRVSELGVGICAAEAFRPIVVITSNTERPLPDAFLRRCVFHHIDPPGPDQLRKILVARFGTDAGFLPSGQDVIGWSIRANEKAQLELSRPPSTSEFVSWVRCLIASGAPGESLPQKGARLAPAMAKNPDDLRVLRKLLLDLR